MTDEPNKKPETPRKDAPPPPPISDDKWEKFERGIGRNNRDRD